MCRWPSGIVQALAMWLKEQAQVCRWLHTRGWSPTRRTCVLSGLSHRRIRTPCRASGRLRVGSMRRHAQDGALAITRRRSGSASWIPCCRRRHRPHHPRSRRRHRRHPPSRRHQRHLQVPLRSGLAGCLRRHQLSPGSSRSRCQRSPRRSPRRSPSRWRMRGRQPSPRQSRCGQHSMHG